MARCAYLTFFFYLVRLKVDLVRSDTKQSVEISYILPAIFCSFFYTEDTGSGFPQTFVNLYCILAFTS